jgi:hypothetical protein
VLQQAGRERLFDKNYIKKPFSANLIDKDKTVLEELYFLGDNTIKVNSTSLWTNIEKELDVFLEKLLK